MNEGVIVCVILMICVAFGLVGYAGGLNAATRAMQLEAIAAGHARYNVDCEGKVSFAWSAEGEVKDAE